MAEFQEVIRERKRMCDTVKTCSKCPLSVSSCDIDGNILSNPKEIEEIVIRWSKEHPKKTNAEKFREVFGVEVVPTTGCSFVPCEVKNCNNCEYKDFWNQEYEEPSEV